METDPAKRRELLQGAHYGLILSFLNGMLEAADPATIIVDGQEGNYYNWMPVRFYRSYQAVHQVGDDLIAPELRNKYRAQVQCGQPIYVDYWSNTRSVHTISTYMSPEERAKCMEHQVYWTLRTSDRYVWFYTEQPGYLINRSIEPVMIPAIDRARQKIARNEELGYEIADLVTRAWRTECQVRERRIEPLTAHISRLADGIAAPKIDGSLDDPAWKDAPKLGPFVNYIVARIKKLEVPTHARMTYDDNALYVAFRCDSPETENIRAPAGEIVEVAIATDEKVTAYYEIRVTCENKRWDSLTKAGVEVYGKDASWTGEYRTAAQKHKDHWAVEIALPWATLKMKAPGAGAKLKGNLLRRSDRHGQFSSWSESRGARYVEAENFGTWVLD